MERLGGSVAPAITADWFGVQGSVLTEYLAEAAALLDLVLHQPKYAEEAVAIERALLAKKCIERRKERVDHYGAHSDGGHARE